MSVAFPVPALGVNGVSAIVQFAFCLFSLVVNIDVNQDVSVTFAFLVEQSHFFLSKGMETEL